MSGPRYSVEFRADVQEELAYLLVGARDREYLSECVVRFDAALRDDPYAVGEGRDSRDARLLFEGGLTALYRVRPAERKVVVLAVARAR